MLILLCWDMSPKFFFMNPHSFYMYHLKVFVNHWYSERFEKLKTQSAEYVNFFLKMYLESVVFSRHLFKLPLVQ